MLYTKKEVEQIARDVSEKAIISFVGYSGEPYTETSYIGGFVHFEYKYRNPSGLFAEIKELKKTVELLEKFLGIEHVQEEKTTKFDGYKKVVTQKKVEKVKSKKVK